MDNNVSLPILKCGGRICVNVNEKIYYLVSIDRKLRCTLKSSNDLDTLSFTGFD